MIDDMRQDREPSTAIVSPSLAPTSSDVLRVVSRLRHSNRALDQLRFLLERDEAEAAYHVEAGPPKPSS